MEFFYVLNFGLTSNIVLDLKTPLDYNCPVSHL